ncbi:rod shape-determining protein MreD [Lacticaseibacillus saniviri]|nr:rod shape-determining protein MreD [Lacticaseibacillus saniviri]MCG4281402.1 rod shape-determining protein MreD [Lacticaseibacillus saniviri]
MQKPFQKHWIAPVFLLVAMIVDGVISQVFAQWLLHPNYTAVPELTLLMLVMLTILLPDENWMVAIAAITGLVFDSFYTGILGINALLMPLVVYVVQQLTPYIFRSALFIGIMDIITLTLFSSADFVMNSFLGYTDVGFTTFIAQHLGPNLLLNMILFVLVYWPLSRLLINLSKG